MTKTFSRVTTSSCIRALTFLTVLLPLGAAGNLHLQAKAQVTGQAPGQATATIPHGTVTMVADVPAIRPNSTFEIAFHFTLEPGWHTYWINPGDSGEPPKLTWHLPAGLRAGSIEWPAPKMLPMPGVMDFGYTGDVALLVPIHSAALPAGKPAEVGAQLRVIVCRELCIPGTAQLSLRLPFGSPATPGHVPEQTADLFASARNSLPKPAPRRWKTHVQQTANQFILEVSTGKAVSRATFFPLDEEQMENAAPQTVQSTPQGFTMVLRKAQNIPHPVTRLRGVIEVPEGAYTVEAPVPAAAPAGKSSRAKSPRGSAS